MKSQILRFSLQLKLKYFKIMINTKSYLEFLRNTNLVLKNILNLRWIKSNTFERCIHGRLKSDYAFNSVLINFQKYVETPPFM